MKENWKRKNGKGKKYDESVALHGYSISLSVMSIK